MAWNEDILSELPAPNSEEPPSLRQDIEDELRDHLECAARREMLARTPAEDIEPRSSPASETPKKSP